LKQLIRVEVLQMGERVWAFRREGLEKVLQGTRGEWCHSLSLIAPCSTNRS
jgi:hypothetical protein